MEGPRVDEEFIVSPEGSGAPSAGGLEGGKVV